MDSLPVWQLAVIIAIPLAAAYGIRAAIFSHILASSLPMDRSRRQVRLDFGLFVAAGIVMALYNYIAFGFPFAQSGLKLVLGAITLGLFTALDLALETEHAGIIAALHSGDALLTPPQRFSPLTHKFFMLASLVTLTVSAIVILIIYRDIYWLNTAGATAANIGTLKRSIFMEISFVMGVLLLYVINLIYSYARNLRLLFKTQTSVLKHVSDGDMNRYVPVSTRDEFGFIAGHTNLMIDALRDRLRLMEGMQIAQQIQQTLIPVAKPEIADVDIAFQSLFSDETGGDFFDFLKGGAQRPSQISIVVGDVTGHGIGAALLMASARAYLRMQAEAAATPASLLTGANRLLAKDNYGTGRFVTLYALQLDEVSKEIHWASAGHDPALVYNAESGEISDLHSAGLPLGVLEDTEYEEQCCRTFLTGDIIFIGTDGIWETMNDHGALFGKERVKAIIRKHAGDPAQEIADAVTNALSHFRGKAQQLDDITLVLLKFM
ncbi:SpoIIE family protein phosphatase [Desulfovibrio mangrovi]|uniref:PP2C family protein-serine/threonine phosphatase n=1 Tax=Desulfovibrio mangrovi TaxID=2976983 RepID=UPI002247F508|nr:SpoIIE family protein phosphatase [Desulfovibrio mangrovi]UZP66648.1 SpoIIE family protein phosphatase [Desulfovibrio mangrovi]